MGRESQSGPGSGSPSSSPPPPSPPEDGEANSCCRCACCCGSTGVDSWRRSVKRKLDLMDASAREVAVVGVENECRELREAVAGQEKTIQELCEELDEERNASSTATNEAMSMILRLQREKAEVQMEARQFRRFAEEKMAHDQEEISALEDELGKREQEVDALLCEIEALRQSLMSYRKELGFDRVNGAAEDDREERGIGASDIEKVGGGGGDSPAEDQPAHDYSSLGCRTPGVVSSKEADDLEKYVSGKTPSTTESRASEHIPHIEHEFFPMGRTENTSQMDMLDEDTLLGDSTLQPELSRRSSAGSAVSFLNRDCVPDCGDHEKHHGEFPVIMTNPSESFNSSSDDMSDRVYMIDAVHGVQVPLSAVGACDDSVGTLKNSLIVEVDIRNLHARVEALEAERESMKQAIISMRADNAQLMLLREVAQRLRKGVAQSAHAPAPESRLINRPSLLGNFSFLPFLKVHIWVIEQEYWIVVTSRQVPASAAMEMSPKTTKIMPSVFQLLVLLKSKARVKISPHGHQLQ